MELKHEMNELCASLFLFDHVSLYFINLAVHVMRCLEISFPFKGLLVSM